MFFYEMNNENMVLRKTIFFSTIRQITNRNFLFSKKKIELCEHLSPYKFFKNFYHLQNFLNTFIHINISQCAHIISLCPH